MHKPWADVIPCTYEMKHTLKELIRVKAFLLAGTTVSIVEEKVSRAGGLASHWLEDSVSTFSPISTFPSCCHIPASPSLSRKDRTGRAPVTSLLCSAEGWNLL